MPERDVPINVTREFRDKIKTLKRELTYEQFLDNLINSGRKIPQSTDTKMTKSKESKIQ